MTISNDNMLPILSSGADVQLDGLMAGQAAGLAAGQDMPQAMGDEVFEKVLQDGDFWSILNQQLTEITVDENLKGVENGLSTDLIHSMKSHFSESELSAIQTELGLPEMAEEVSVPAVALLNAMQESLDTGHLNGDKLPPSGQIASAFVAGLDKQMSSGQSTETTLPLKPDSIVSENQLKSAVVPVDLNRTLQKGFENSLASGQVNIDAESLEQGAKLLTGKSSELELPKSEGLQTEKLQFKLSAVEQSGAVVKDNTVSVLSSVSPLSTSPSQNQINQLLPSSLQTLQLAPQATASQWGDALGEKVSLLLSNKLNTAEIRLDPPHLGKLDIQIQLKEESATITIHTQHAQTRDLIDSASARLREFLQEAGYDSVDVDVSHREQTLAQDDMSQQHQQQDGDDQQHLSSRNEMTGMHQGELSLMLDNGRIDFFA